MSQGLIDASFVTVTEKIQKSLCSFFHFLPFLFFTVFLSTSITSVWHVPDGLRRENNMFWPSVPPSSSMPGSSSFSQQAVGGLATAPLSASHLHPSATTRINRSATPYKRSTEVHASQHSAPPTMTSHVAQDWERGSENKTELLQIHIKMKWKRIVKIKIHLFYFEKILCVNFWTIFVILNCIIMKIIFYNNDPWPLFWQILSVREVSC